MSPVGASSASATHSMGPNHSLPSHTGEMLEYGCVPASLIAQLKSVDRNADYRVRNAAVDEIARRLAECAASQQRHAVLGPHLGALVRLLAVLLHDSNMKIVQTALLIVLDLADKMPAEFRPNISLILSRLVEKFGDKVPALRLAALQVLYKLMATNSFDLVCYQLMCCLKYPSALVREHAVIVLTYVLLCAAEATKAPAAKLDTRQMAAELVGALSDQKPRVVSVVIELLAVLAEPRWLGTRYGLSEPVPRPGPMFDFCILCAAALARQILSFPFLTSSYFHFLSARFSLNNNREHFSQSPVDERARPSRARAASDAAGAVRTAGARHTRAAGQRRRRCGGGAHVDGDEQ